jgi:hypothetical protein
LIPDLQAVLVEVHHVEENPFASGGAEEGIVVLAELERADGAKEGVVFLLSLSMLMAMSSFSSLDTLSDTASLFSKSSCTLFKRSISPPRPIGHR